MWSVRVIIFIIWSPGASAFHWIISPILTWLSILYKINEQVNQPNSQVKAGLETQGRPWTAKLAADIGSELKFEWFIADQKKPNSKAIPFSYIIHGIPETLRKLNVIDIAAKSLIHKITKILFKK